MSKVSNIHDYNAMWYTIRVLECYMTPPSPTWWSLSEIDRIADCVRPPLEFLPSELISERPWLFVQRQDGAVALACEYKRRRGTWGRILDKLLGRVVGPPMESAA